MPSLACDTLIVVDARYHGCYALCAHILAHTCRFHAFEFSAHTVGISSGGTVAGCVFSLCHNLLHHFYSVPAKFCACTHRAQQPLRCGTSRSPRLFPGHRNSGKIVFRVAATKQFTFTIERAEYTAPKQRLAETEPGYREYSGVEEIFGRHAKAAEHPTTIADSSEMGWRERKFKKFKFSSDEISFLVRFSPLQRLSIGRMRCGIVSE